MDEESLMEALVVWMMAACARAQESWTGATSGIARALMAMTLRHYVLFWDGSGLVSCQPFASPRGHVFPSIEQTAEMHCN